MPREAVHDWPNRDHDCGPDYRRESKFAVTKGNYDDTNEDNHRQRSEGSDTSAPNRNPERSAQRRFGFPKSNQCAEFQKERDRIEKHVGDDQFTEGNEDEN